MPIINFIIASEVREDKETKSEENDEEDICFILCS